jgi:hypothetical protein
MGPQTAPVPVRRASMLARLPLVSESWFLDLACLLVFCAIAIALYGAYATKGAWYYDDWSLYALMRDAHGGFFAEVNACAASIPGSRTLACLYHAGEYSVFASHRTDYQFASMAWLIADATLVYLIAKRCCMRRGWALLLGALLVLFPADDATRLWDTASIGQYVVALALGSALLALIALGFRGRRSLLLGGASAVLAVFAMATYEIAIPLVALSGVLYVLVYRSRRALAWWALDIGLVLAFLIYRVLIEPVSSTSGLNVHRSVAQTIDRVRTLLRAAWSTWKFVYVPGRVGSYALVVLVVVVVVSVAVARDAVARMRIARWLALGLFGVAVAAASALVFLTANDYYVPVAAATFNRLNLPGSFGYIVVAVALLGVVCEIAVQITRRRLVGVAAVVALVVPSAAHQISISRSHIQAWEASWTAQQQAIAGYRVALRGVPSNANVVGFDTPIWESGYVPVFAASWDLRGAIDYETAVNPPIAWPLFPGLSCGATGVLDGATVAIPYSTPGAPTYFVSPVRRVARIVNNERDCSRTIAQWGRAPLFAPTVG